MEIVIKGQPDEIAALVFLTQGWQPFADLKPEPVNEDSKET